MITRRCAQCSASEPDLATAYLGDPDQARTALHVATDWPGHFPGVAATDRACSSPPGPTSTPRSSAAHAERPLHWAASSDDVEAIAALLAAGADLEAPGGVLTGGPPLDDAIVFDNLAAARALVAAGATVALFHAAALGLDDRVAELIPATPTRRGSTPRCGTPAVTVTPAPPGCCSPPAPTPASAGGATPTPSPRHGPVATPSSFALVERAAAS